jgi:ketosteroid isomerase-like protein
MSQENVQIVRASIDAWNAGDMNALRELYDRNVILRAPEDWPESEPAVGREETMLRFKQLRETWDADATEPITDFIDVADRVVVRAIWRGAGHGPESTIEFTIVFTVRKGKIYGVEYFWDHGEALETLGLSEQDNVAIARRAWKEYVDRGVEGVLGYFAKDCVIEDYPEMPDRADYVGWDGVRERDRHFAEIWGNFVIEPVEFIDGGGNVVVVTVEIRGHGKGSGAPIDAPTAFVHELRDGKIVRDRAFTSKDQALAAAGIEE